MSEEPTSTTVVQRLWQIAWRYRAGCLRALTLQTALLLFTIAGLALTGLAIDFIHHTVAPAVKAPAWPFEWAPPADWTPMAVLSFLGTGILLTALARARLTYIYNTMMVRLVQGGIVVDLRSQAYDKLQRLSFRFFDENASGTLINRITSDVQSVRLFVDGVLIPGVILILSLVIYMIYMFQIDIWLTLACLSTTPLLWLISRAYARSVNPEYKVNRDLVDRMILALSESVQGIHVIKGFAREPQELERLAKTNQAVRDQKETIFFRTALFHPAIEMLNHINVVILLGYGGWLVIRGNLALGTGLVVFLSLLQRFAGQVNTISNITDNIQQSIIASRRVFEVLDMPIEIRDAPNAVALPRAHGAISFEKVSFAYAADKPVLRDITLSINAGSCVGILGTTGSGKSTLLSLVPRFYDPALGRVTLDGIDIRAISLDDLRRQVGIVFQESFLFSTTIAANIAFGKPHADRAAITAAAKLAAAHDFIMELPQGYDSVIGEGGSDLSGGQRQRLAIARAVLLDPPILLLDDPLAAVDSETEHEIIAALDTVMPGRTTLLVSHRIGMLQRADMIIVMHDGQITQRGTHKELMTMKGHYRRTAHLQLPEMQSGTTEGGAP